ncbi:hypothetical protein H0E87_029843 [Populus deltoides]|uniref:MYB transcription factor n=1 Tax=Populus deltoides TaxID=3696 RepID=A0A8T2WQY7_POPDE|nr:hypothetical protein H0E87_029843 [Populus deltoides]
MPLAPRRSKCGKREANKGAWTAEEDQKLARVIEIHGPKRWRSIAAKAEKTNVLGMDNIAKGREEGTSKRLEDSKSSFVGDDFFDFSNEDPVNLEWMNKFLELEESLYEFP